MGGIRPGVASTSEPEADFAAVLLVNLYQKEEINCHGRA